MLSDGPSPNDHARLLVELLRPLGVELARRWLAALLLVDERERASMVAAVERQIVELYSAPAEASDDVEGASSQDREIRLVSPPVRRNGYVEQKITTYAVKAGKAAPSRSARTKRA